MKNLEDKTKFKVGDKVEFIEDIGINKGYSFFIRAGTQGIVKEIWPYLEKMGCCGLTVEAYDVNRERHLAVVAGKYVKKIYNKKLEGKNGR